MERIFSGPVLFVLISLIQPSIQDTYYASVNDTIVSESVSPCHLYGDSDIYGIGIRISFYIQWSVIIIALVGGFEDEIKSTRRGFNIVSLAVMINTFHSVANGGFAVLEIFIVSTLVLLLSAYFITPFGGRTNIRYVHTNNPPGSKAVLEHTEVPIFSLGAFREDPIGIAVLLLIDTAFLFSQPWLYFKTFQRSNKRACRPIIWVFFRSIQLDERGWIIFVRFVSIISVLVGIFTTGLAIWALKFGLFGEDYNEEEPEIFKRWKRAKAGLLPLIDLELSSPLCGCIPREPIRRFVGNARALLQGAKNNSMRILVAMTGSFFIAFVEMTIKVNNIDLRRVPLTSTSQLLPLLVGLFSAVSVLWVSVRKYQKEKNMTESRVDGGATLNELIDALRRFQESNQAEAAAQPRA